jgi:hypothetical protein
VICWEILFGERGTEKLVNGGNKIENESVEKFYEQNSELLGDGNEQKKLIHWSGLHGRVEKDKTKEEIKRIKKTFSHIQSVLTPK